MQFVEPADNAHTYSPAIRCGIISQFRTPVSPITRAPFAGKTGSFKAFVGRQPVTGLAAQPDTAYPAIDQQARGHLARRIRAEFTEILFPDQFASE